MSIKYESVTGQIVQIDVPDNIGKVSIEIERNIFNNDRKETRRHNSIEAMRDQGLQFEDKCEDAASLIEEKEINEALHIALDKLLPQQKELVHKVFFENISIAQIACDKGVNEAAIRNRLNKIYKKLKKFLN